MARNKNEVLDPTELPGRLRKMAFWGAIGFALLLFALIATTVINLQHTTDVVGSSNQILNRGDCRSAATADLWTDLSNNLTDLANLLQHASTPQGSPARLKIPGDADSMKDHSEKMTVDAERYVACAPPSNSPTTTKGS